MDQVGADSELDHADPAAGRRVKGDPLPRGPAVSGLLHIPVDEGEPNLVIDEGDRHE